MITKVTEYQGRIDFEPTTCERGTIDHFDEVEEALFNISPLIGIFWGNPACSPYVEFVTETSEAANELHKYIIDILTRYRYGILGE